MSLTLCLELLHEKEGISVYHPIKLDMSAEDYLSQKGYVEERREVFSSSEWGESPSKLFCMVVLKDQERPIFFELS